MSFGLVYWITMLVCFLFGVWRATSGDSTLKAKTGDAVLFILFVLLGWKVFGPPIHD